jgi:hypothetical protein
MNDESNPTIEGIAEVLADGMPVDWDGLREREPALADRIARLKAVAEVAAAYRELREGPGPESEPSTG